jgi:hypothetical protein
MCCDGYGCGGCIWPRRCVSNKKKKKKKKKVWCRMLCCSCWVCHLVKGDMSLHVQCTYFPTWTALFVVSGTKLS